MQYFGRLAWWVYSKLRSEYTRSINIKDWAEIATD